MISHDILTLTVNQISERINIPLPHWAGNCAAIAHALVANGLVEGEEVRGLWVGPINKKSTFYGHPFAGHSWVELPDGMIIDPTRFAFEGAQPYVYVGYDEEGYYDAGGNIVRAMFHSAAPTPNPDDRLIELELDSPSRAYVLDWLNNLAYEVTSTGITVRLNQAYWLANLSLQQLGLVAKPLYTALTQAKLKAAVPLDNYRKVMR